VTIRATSKIFCKRDLAHAGMKTSRTERLADSNTQVSDDTIKLGTVGIDDIINNMYTRYSTSGVYDTGDVTLDGQLISGGMGGEVQDITLTVHPEGACLTWIHKAFLGAPSAAIKATAKCEDVTNTPTCPSTMAYCPCT
jgi:hypothetical protein